MKELMYFWVAVIKIGTLSVDTEGIPIVVRIAALWVTASGKCFFFGTAKEKPLDHSPPSWHHCGQQALLQNKGMFSMQHVVCCTKASCNMLWKASGRSLNPSPLYWLWLSPTQLTAPLGTSASLAQRGDHARLPLWVMSTVDLFWPLWKKGKEGEAYTEVEQLPQFIRMHFISVKLFIYDEKGLLKKESNIQQNATFEVSVQSPPKQPPRAPTDSSTHTIHSMGFMLDVNQ